LNPHEELVICWDLVLGLYSIVEINPCQSAIRVDLHSLTLHKPTSECLLAVLVKVEDYFVPAIIELQRHRTLEWLYSCDRLIIAGDECALHVLVIEDSHFEPEVFIKLHRKEATFLTSSTRMGILTFMERLF
jgi:hypothetical protein